MKQTGDFASRDRQMPNASTAHDYDPSFPKITRKELRSQIALQRIIEDSALPTPGSLPSL